MRSRWPLISFAVRLGDGVLDEMVTIWGAPPNPDSGLVRESSSFDAAPNLVPAGLLAMQGRYLGTPR